MRRLILAAMIVSTCLAGEPPTAQAVEAWADPRLTVREGLALWLDAAAQARLRPTADPAALVDGVPAGEWIDGAGGLHFSCADAEQTPTWHKLGEVALMRFLGRGQHLAAELPPQRRQLDAVTVFLVAAPFHNDGDFTGLLAMHAAGKADYVTGLNVDLGFAPTDDFSAVNVEGAGFGGQQNLRTGGGPFSKFHRLCVTSQTGPGGVQLYVDGIAEGRRDRAASKLAADRVIVGGRFTAHSADVERFFAGDLAEVILYDRVLTDEERQAVDAYLAAKYDGVVPPPPPSMRLAAGGSCRSHRRRPCRCTSRGSPCGSFRSRCPTSTTCCTAKTACSWRSPTTETSTCCATPTATDWRTTPGCSGTTRADCAPRSAWR